MEKYLLEDKKQFVNYILDSSDRILGLIDEVRLLSKDHTSVQYNLQPCPLNKLLTDVVALAKTDNEVKGHRIQVFETQDIKLMINRNKII